jgi:hypothetical protein
MLSRVVELRTPWSTQNQAHPRATKPYATSCFNLSAIIINPWCMWWAWKKKWGPKNLEALGCGPACPASGPALPIRHVSMSDTYMTFIRHVSEDSKKCLNFYLFFYFASTLIGSVFDTCITFIKHVSGNSDNCFKTIYFFFVITHLKHIEHIPETSMIWCLKLINHGLNALNLITIFLTFSK